VSEGYAPAGSVVYEKRIKLLMSSSDTIVERMLLFIEV
jgi:hypothetical protein